jgi:hypothetical protein
MQSLKRIGMLGPVQREVVRRAARRCLVSCLLALKPGDWARQRLPEWERTLPDQGAAAKTPLHCGSAQPCWQAALLEKFVRRLECRKWDCVEALAAPAEQGRRQREAAGFDLAAFLTLIFVPTASFVGQWSLAAQETVRFLRLQEAASSHQNLQGQRPPGESYPKLLTAPVLWSLAFAHPRLQEPAAPPLGRPDQLLQATAVTDLFTALNHFPALPVSVCWAAGTLAAVAGPPVAGAWIEAAHELAVGHGANGFARFFSQLSRSTG